MPAGNQTAPYAPVDNVLGLIRRFRERRLPEVLTIDALTQADVPRGSAPRTLAALRFLGLVDAEGECMEGFRRLSQATSEQYREQLAQIVRAAYALIFRQVDPTTAGDLEIADAFRQYQPHAQRQRMISLFRALCQEAGIIEGGPPERRRKQQRTSSNESPSSGPVRTKADRKLLTSLLEELPPEGAWTRALRDRWLKAFEANLDLTIEVVGENAPQNNDLAS